VVVVVSAAHRQGPVSLALRGGEVFNLRRVHSRTSSFPPRTSSSPHEFISAVVHCYSPLCHSLLPPSHCFHCCRCRVRRQMG
jgi:hypothetical protein